MFRGTQIKELVDLLDCRGILLYHSCQYVDFLSYLELGGIPSRKKLSDEKKEYTKFKTDNLDQKNVVWDKVFLNLQDFGEMFEKGNGVPTVYGPIHFLVHPKALLEASDVAVSLRSAGSPNFNRSNEALKSIGEVENIFKHPSDSGDNNRKDLKSIDDLKTDFRRKYVSYPEISITLSESMLSLTYVSKVRIDPYYFADNSLIKHIASTKKNRQTGLNGVERKYYKKQRIIINDITKLLLISEPSLEKLIDNPDIGPETKEWASSLKNKNKGLDIQWLRYARYLREGTLLPIYWGLYKCYVCGKLVMGFHKEEHVKEIHKDRSVEWMRIK